MISIIIPVCNEAAFLNTLLPFLKKNAESYLAEIIVVGAKTSDESKEICESFGANFLETDVPNRAIQMNRGAAMATGDVFYFVHADTLPPTTFASQIMEANKAGVYSGRFKTVFDSRSWLLMLNAYFTKYDWFMCYGGDQTLFVEADLFKEINGFNESLAIMEDYEITERVKQRASYKVLNDVVRVSARKYKDNSWWAVQRANIKAVKAYKKRVDTEIIKKEYWAGLKKNI